MELTDNIRIANSFPDDYAGQFVVCFGSAQCPDSVAPQFVHHMPEPTGEDLATAEKADPNAMVKGLLFILDPQDETLDMRMVRDIQKEYFRRYFKRVVFPRFSPCTEDPFGVRKVEVPELVRTISRLQNIPFIFRYPLADKLLQQDIGAPVLLLLPGPSLKLLAPHLEEFSKYFLIVAISRTLQFCLDNGVEPDFVVQLDTFLVQKHFYEDIPALPNTVLVTLSCTHIRQYAHKFRGIFFVGSFNSAFLTNTWRMRENPVSTLMGCMGLAECLQSKTAVLYGADLCFDQHQQEGQQYFSADDGDPGNQKLEGPQHIAQEGEQFVVSDRRGNRMHSLLRYIATAGEAEHFARDIRETVGTKFYCGNDQGMLSTEFFPTMDIAGHIAELASLDRQAILDKIDTALKQKEPLRLAHFMEDCVQHVNLLNQHILYFESCKLTEQCGDLKQNPIRMFADKERDYYLPENDTVRLNFSSKIAKKWRYYSNQARNITLAHILAMRGTEIALVCLPDEADTLPDALRELFPKFRWKIHPLTNFVRPEQHPPHKMIPAHMIHRTLPKLRVVFVSAATKSRYDYQFDMYAGDNLVHLGEFLPGKHGIHWSPDLV